MVRSDFDPRFTFHGGTDRGTKVGGCRCAYMCACELVKRTLFYIYIQEIITVLASQALVNRRETSRGLHGGA